MARTVAALMCAAVAAAACNAAAAAADARDVPVNTVPEGWIISGRAGPATELEMVVVVKRENLALLESELYAVSDPKSPRYGRHLSQRQVSAITHPVSAGSAPSFARWLT
jgi:hypothetical protein